ncbi:Zinc finger MYND domain-containing protein [Pyrenophora teres f. teres]|nr:Zinc finger MYND domain-containing protein [Pyrenophora teres f. teres]
MMERRDSAQSDTRRSSDGSVSSQPTHPSTLSLPAFNRPELFHSLRPMASTESLNVSLTSKPCTSCSGAPARRRCSRCKAAYYCDRNCQKSDWKTHRNVCEPITQTYSAPATPNFSNPASPTTEN